MVFSNSSTGYYLSSFPQDQNRDWHMENKHFSLVWEYLLQQMKMGFGNDGLNPTFSTLQLHELGETTQSLMTIFLPLVK